MLLRVRVRLPDRPGSLGKVARVMGVAGADVVQMTVLERDAGRALDDFTVEWPTGASIDRLCEGLATVPGVEVEGLWPTAESQGAFPDAALVGQLASEPADALAILTDGVPGILSADWAGLLKVDVESAAVHPGPAQASIAHPAPAQASLVHTSLVRGDDDVRGRVLFADIDLPQVRPLRARAFTSQDGTQYAVCPIGTDGLAILVARTAAPRFHRTEVSRLAQLVGAAEAVIGEQLSNLSVTGL